MEFVLIDNQIIVDHTERVSRLSNGVRNLQEKMSRIMGHLHPEQNDRSQMDMEVQDELDLSEVGAYNEPLVVQEGSFVEEYIEPEDTTQSFESSFSDDKPTMDEGIDLDLDLDKMLADMRFDDEDLGL